MKCSVCGKTNISPAHILGHGGRGVSKNISEEERQARRVRARAAQKKRWPGIMKRIAIVQADGVWTAYEMDGDGPKFGRKVFTSPSFEEVDCLVAEAYPLATRPAQRRSDGSVYWTWRQQENNSMPVIRIIFKEPARLCIFDGELPSGHSNEVDVAAGDVWYAPTTQGNLLMATAQKHIPVENDGWATFHDLGAISRTTDDPAQWARIRAENKGVGIIPRPQVPLYEARVIDFEPVDSTHEDYIL